MVRRDKRARTTGKRGSEAERFARIPENVLKSGAYWTLSHGAARVLTLLVCGATEQKNGRLELTDARAHQLGLRSHDLVARSLPELIRVGLVVQTRKVPRKARHAAQYAVTWWPVAFADGVVLTPPDTATHAYLKFNREPSTRKVGGKLIRSPRSSGDITPTIGAKSCIHHPDGPVESAIHHPDHRGTLKSLGGTSPFVARLCALSAQLRAPTPAHAVRKAEAQTGAARSSERIQRIPSVEARP